MASKDLHIAIAQSEEDGMPLPNLPAFRVKAAKQLYIRIPSLDSICTEQRTEPP